MGAPNDLDVLSAFVRRLGIVVLCVLLTGLVAAASIGLNIYLLVTR